MQSPALPRYTLAGLLVATAAVLALAGLAWRAADQTLRAASFVSHTQAVLGTIDLAESDSTGPRPVA